MKTKNEEIVQDVIKKETSTKKRSNNKNKKITKSYDEMLFEFIEKELRL